MTKKFILRLGLFTYGALLLLALFFYQERVIFSDVAYILFELITEGDYAIQVHRYVSLFTQSFGLVASKLGLTLKSVAMIHSAGFIIYYCSIFLILLLALKDKELALGFIFFNTLMVCHSFYWIPSELIQGAGFVFLYFSVINKITLGTKSSYYLSLLSLAFLTTAVFAHPLIIFSLIYGLIFFAIDKGNKYFLLGIHILMAILIFVFKIKFLPNDYDSNAMKGVTNLSSMIDRINLNLFKDYLKYLVSDYLFLSLGLILSCSHYLLRKQYLKFTNLIGFFCLYSLIVHIGHSNLKEQYYMESQYLILFIFVILPITFDVLKSYKDHATTKVIITIISVSILRIMLNHEPYTSKINWQKKFLTETSKYEEKKLVLTKNQVPMNILLEHWGSAFEFWLLSTIETGETRSIIITDPENKYDWLIEKQQKDLFIAIWNSTEYQFLDPRYFVFKDRETYYRKLNNAYSDIK